MLTSQIFKDARNYFYQHGFSWSLSLKLAYRKDRIYKALLEEFDSEEIAQEFTAKGMAFLVQAFEAKQYMQFTYFKVKTGEERQARGTLENLTSTKLNRKGAKRNFLAIAYKDLDKGGYRSFNILSLYSFAQVNAA